MSDTPYEIYDIINKANIQISKSNPHPLTRQQFYALTHEVNKTCNERYVLAKNKSYLFTLIDWQSKQEYECCTNKSIFIHLGLPYSDNLGKYVYALKIKTTNFISLDNRLFYLKGNDVAGKYPLAKTISSISALDDIRKLNKIKNTLRSRLRNRLIHALKKNKKSLSITQLIGCPLEDVVKHLEAQFQAGMSWDNHGKWHIDHIRPCASFNLFDPKEQAICFNFMNLQPLWAIDNQIKYDHYQLTNPDNQSYSTSEK